MAVSKAEVADLETVRKLASSKEHLKVIADFREFVMSEIDQVYRKVDGDRIKLKEQVNKCEQQLELKAQDSDVSEVVLTCQRLDKEVQDSMHKVNLQDERIARLSYSKKLEDLEFQVDILHKLLAEAANTIGKMQEDQIYKEGYAEAVSTKPAYPSCLSCGGKPHALSPKVVTASGLLGKDRRFYKGDDLYNNIMMPGRKRFTLTEPLSFTEDSSESPDKRSRALQIKLMSPLPGVMPAMTARLRTTSESPSWLMPGPVRGTASTELTRRRVASQTRGSPRD
jgi:hypothetical protein